VFWFGGDMPLSNWDPGCPGAGSPPVWPGVGLPALWLGGDMPLSIWDPGCCGAGAPPPFWTPPTGPAPGCVAPLLGCAMTQWGATAEITAMTPTTAHSTQIHLLKRKTPHPRLEPASPRTTLASGHKALYKLDDPKVDEVVPRGEHH